MVLPRIGIIESLLVLIMVLILATIASFDLFLTMFGYIAAIFFLAVAIREAAHFYLKDHKPLKGRNLERFANALIVAVPVGIIFKLVERTEASIFGFLFLALLLGLVIESQYKWKQDRHRPFVLGLGIIIVLYLFEVLIYLLYAPFSML